MATPWASISVAMKMSEVVQPELADSGAAAVSDEHLGDTVRKPRHRAVRFGAEHKRLVGQQTFVLSGSLGRSLEVTGESLHAGLVEGYAVGAVGLGGA